MTELHPLHVKARIQGFALDLWIDDVGFCSFAQKTPEEQKKMVRSE